MEYEKEIEEQLERIKASKIEHIKAREWERAAACREIERQVQAQLEEAKKVLSLINAKYNIK